MKKTITLLMYLFFSFIGYQVNGQIDENFDSFSSGAVPTGWTTYTTESDDPGFMVTSTESHSAPNSLYHKDDDVASVSTSWIVAPVYTLTGNDLLSFFVYQKYDFSYNYSGVWYSTTGTDPTANPNDWTEIQEFDENDPSFDGWTFFSHTFNETAGTTIYVAFKYTGDYAHRLYIDDFKLDVAPSCMAPVDPTASPISVTEANLDWSENGTATNWEIEYGVTGFTQGSGTIVSVSSKPYTLTGLTAETTYDYYVRSSCGGGDFSDWVGPITWTQPPVNDVCSNAISLTVYAQGSGSGNEIAASTNHATDSGQHPSCDDVGTNLDLWYTFTAPASGHLKLITGGATGSDIEAAIYDSCGGAELDCQDRSSEKIFRGLTPGQTYVLQVWHDDFKKGDFTLVLEDVPIIIPVYTTTVNPDCASNQFTVDIDITDLGGSSSVTVSDDQGSTSQQVSATGTITFGPYASGTTVVFTLTSDDDANVTDTATVSYACPPANDACADATEVATLPFSATEDASDATNNDGFITPSGCGYGMNDGVWYTFTVGTAGTIQVEVTPNAWDAEVAVYTGGCGSFVCVDNADSNGNGGVETITFAADAGTQYWVNIGYYSGSSDGPEGPFDISITSSDGATLSLADNVIEGFNMSPNPVTNLLTLQADDNIQQIKVYNVLGQVVLKAMPNAKVVRLNTQLLPAGAYIVKVKAGNQIGAYHLIKQ